MVDLSEFEDDDTQQRALGERYRRERDAARRYAGVLDEQIEKLRAELGIRHAVHGIVLDPPKWQTKQHRKGKGKYHAIAQLNFSDWHFDEVVQPELMNYVNAYNRRIGEIRLRQWADSVIQVAEMQTGAIEWDGAVLSINGDVFSGWIHRLKETNDGDGLIKDVRHWARQIASAVELLLQVFPTVSVYCTVGNHGRLSVKWDSKRAISENIEYLLGLTLQDWFEQHPKVNVAVAESVDLLFPIYDLKFLQTHGNTGGGNGGSGLAGFWPRLARMRLSKQTLYRSQGGFDIVVCGHFHKYSPAVVGRSGVLVNGAGKGFDDYARDYGFDAEEAIQAMMQVSPERGVTGHFPIFVADRKAEGW